MTERGIIPTADDVRRIQAGTKSMFRRAMRPQPPDGWAPTVGMYAPICVDRHGEEYPGTDVFGAADEDYAAKAPYAPGDRLYVRETWGASCGSQGCRFEENFSPGAPECHACDCLIMHYKADPIAMADVRWRSAATMPRWAARIWLVVAAVRAERLQSITEADARAEGFDCSWLIYREGDKGHNARREAIFAKYGEPFGDTRQANERDEFAYSWDATARPGQKWNDNPWVWVTTAEKEA